MAGWFVVPFLRYSSHQGIMSSDIFWSASTVPMLNVVSYQKWIVAPKISRVHSDIESLHAIEPLILRQPSEA